MDAAYVELGEGHFRAGPLTGGPWRPEHQHAGPPSALICRAVERAASDTGLTHLGRLTVNLVRRPAGEWICLEARSLFGGNGCGLAESALYDEEGLIGQATQSLAVGLR